MNNLFKLEKSIFFMMAFVFSIGLLFLFIRSEYVLELRHFSQQSEQKALTQNQEALAAAYHVPSYLILTGSDQPQLEKAIVSRLAQMGKQPVTMPIEKASLAEGDFEGIIVATENIHALPDPDTLLHYVEKGGSLFFAIRPSPGPVLSALYQHMGIVETGTFLETSGVVLTEPFFGSSHSQSFPSEDILNSSLSIRLSPEADVYAVSTSSVPLLWTHAYEKGTFIFFNGSFFSAASNHALFIKGLQLMTPEMIYPVINAQVTALEGFPFPMPDGQFGDSGLTNSDYYKHIFWAEMQRIESKYDLNYTASFDAAFGAGHNAFDLPKTQESIAAYGRELIRMGGEMAIQGAAPANKNTAQAKKIMQQGAGQLEQALPGYAIRSYIPVEQAVPLSGLSAVRQAYGSLHAVLASVEKPALKNSAAVLPKTADGFHLDQYEEWLVFNERAASGYFAQSLHPQQFLRGADAESSLRGFAAFQKEIKQDTPWLRKLTLADSSAAAQNYLFSHLYEEPSAVKKVFHASSLKAPAYYFFSSARAIAATENCSAVKIGSSLYLIEAHELTFTIELED